MSNVYIVTCGEYSDYYIDSVWDTLEKANEYIELKKAREKYFDANPVEEYEINTHKPYVGFEVFVYLENGEQQRVISNVVCANCNEFKEVVSGYGKTEEQALKSARDYRMKILAERNGLT